MIIVTYSKAKTHHSLIGIDYHRLFNPIIDQKDFIMSVVISRYLNCRDNRLPTMQSQHLFALTKEVRIEHEGEEYRLRLTRNNRLILTK